MNIFYPYIRKNLARIMIGFICMIIINMTQLYIPQIIKAVVDDMSFGNFDTRILFRQCATIVVLGILISGFRYIWRTQLIGSASEFEKSLREKFFSQLLRLDAAYYNSNKTGDIMARGVSDIGHIKTAFGNGLMLLIDTVFLGTATLAIMIWINPELTLFALLPMLVLMVIVKKLGKKTYFLHYIAQKHYASLTNNIREGFLGIRILKIFNLEKVASHIISLRADSYNNVNSKKAIVYGSIRPIVRIFFDISSIIILLFGGYLAVQKQITPGELVAFLQYLGILAWPIIAVGMITNMFQRGKASFKRVHDFLKTEPSIYSPIGAPPFSAVYSNIHFENLQFSYDKRTPVLSGISFTIPKGSLTGITGPAGSGKTTLSQLILRRYDPSEGKILFDKRETSQINLDELCNHIAIMPQEPFLFSNTIKENIVLGKTVEEEKLNSILKICCLEETLEKFPKGLNTVVGEKGITLSGGQKQRIALARTLILDRQLLVLDDPLSQVDSKTAAHIVLGLKHMRGEKTVIIISQRITSLAACDNIYIFKNGQIENSGTHESLINTNKFYKKAYDVQKFEENYFAK